MLQCYNVISIILEKQQKSSVGRPVWKGKRTMATDAAPKLVFRQVSLRDTISPYMLNPRLMSGVTFGDIANARHSHSETLSLLSLGQCLILHTRLE